MFDVCPKKMTVYCCIRQICANRALLVGQIANNYRDLTCAGQIAPELPHEFPNSLI
jgi:hypothetical protein